MRVLLRVVRVVSSSVYLAVLTLVGAPVLLVVTVLAGLLFLPLPATIPVPIARAVALPTTIYDRAGGVIGFFQQADQNVPVTADQIPAVVREAVIADEDRNFYRHGGVDLRGTLRALLADVRSNRVVQGGSTITQQYVKLAYVGSQRNIVRKVREAILASQLDRQAPKDEILYRYLTLVYFGDGNYGVGAAAQNYFHVPVSQLDASQAATLAGLIPAPSSRNPNRDPASAEAARVLVLGKMLQQRYLTEAQYEAALAEHLVAGPPGAPAPAGSTAYYTNTVAVSPYPAFLDYLQRWLESHGYSDQDIYSGGLRIQTTLDSKREQAALLAVGTTLKGAPGTVQMAMASVEPQTGFVQALVGSRAYHLHDANLAISGCDQGGIVGPAVQAAADPKATCWDGNVVDNAGAPGRQPGSSWKPFVLATAFMQGIQPTAVYNGPPVYDIPGCVVLRGHPVTDCQVKNAESYGGGQYTLAGAMAASVNTVYAQLARQVGCANVARTAKLLGVDSAYYSPKVFPYCETYALGELDVAPLDMASAYGVFDDHGQRAVPTPVLELVNAAGKVLIDNITKPPVTTQVIPANIADNVTNVLQGVLQPGGTAGAHPLDRPAAGKTGTTNNETNAWFTGFTPTLSTSVWMGYPSQSQPLGDINGVYPVFGGTIPAATWATYMTAALASVPPTPFSQPAPITPPVVAAGLDAGGSRPKGTIGPGPAGYVQQVPAGGPYEVGPSSPPVAVPPAQPFVPGPTPTTPPSTAATTTLPGDTTTTAPPGSGGSVPVTTPGPRRTTTTLGLGG